MIDWNNDDGVNLPMINDFMRNQFYENIIKNNVKDKTVLDIGFGTGLLSMLALKHGANKIVAYESNPERYQLGLNIIQDCGLQSKIDLANKRYTWQDLDQLNVDVVVSETVSNNLWQEGMWSSLPRKSGVVFLPGKYFLEIHVQSVSKTFAETVNNTKTETQFFTPGVDLDTTFINSVNKHISNWNKKPVEQINRYSLTNSINSINNGEGPYGWIPWARMIINGNSLNKTITVEANSITVNKKTIDFSQRYLTAKIDNLDQDQYYMVGPRVGLQHDQHKLYLDASDCWGRPSSGVLIHGLSQCTVTHDVHRGDILYTP